MQKTRRKLFKYTALLAILAGGGKSLAINNLVKNINDNVENSSYTPSEEINKLMLSDNIEEVFNFFNIDPLQQLSPLIKINHPQIHENGYFTPIEIISNIPETSKIAFVVERNPHVFVAEFNFATQMIPRISFEAKITRFGVAYALIFAQNKWHWQKTEINVIRGGCQ